MSIATATEIAPARSRTPSRAVRKRDERSRRLIRWIKKSATFLDKPHYAPLLRIYAETVLDRATLRANVVERYGSNYLDELGHAIPALETLQRLGKTCAAIGRELGLSPGAERALRHDAATEASHRKWLELAKDAEVVPPAPAPTSVPEPAATNGTHRPGFTAPT